MAGIIERKVTSVLKLLTISAIVLFLSSMTSTTDKIIGTWESVNKGDGTMVFYKVGTEYRAKLLSASSALETDGETYKKDINNPDPKLHNRSLKEIVYITKLKLEDGVYVDGELYDFEGGKTYDCKVTVSDNKLFLRVYMGFVVLGKTIEFNKVKTE